MSRRTRQCLRIMLDGDEHPTVKTYDESKGRASKPNAFRNFPFFFQQSYPFQGKKNLLLFWIQITISNVIFRFPPCIYLFIFNSQGHFMDY